MTLCSTEAVHSGRRPDRPCSCSQVGLTDWQHPAAATPSTVVMLVLWKATHAVPRPDKRREVKRWQSSPLLTTGCLAAPFLQARAFAKARSRGGLDSYTTAVATAIAEADNQDDVVEVRPVTPGSRNPCYSCWHQLHVMVSLWLHPGRPNAVRFRQSGLCSPSWACCDGTNAGHALAVSGTAT